MATITINFTIDDSFVQDLANARGISFADALELLPTCDSRIVLDALQGELEELVEDDELDAPYVDHVEGDVWVAEEN